MLDLFFLSLLLPYLCPIRSSFACGLHRNLRGDLRPVLCQELEHQQLPPALSMLLGRFLRVLPLRYLLLDSPCQLFLLEKLHKFHLTFTTTHTSSTSSTLCTFWTTSSGIITYFGTGRCTFLRCQSKVFAKTVMDFTIVAYSGPDYIPTSSNSGTSQFPTITGTRPLPPASGATPGHQAQTSFAPTTT